MEQDDKGRKESGPDRAIGVHPDELGMLVDAVEDYAIFLLSPSGVIQSWNRGAERIMGYTASEVIGRNFSIFYDAEARAGRKPERELEEAASIGRIEDEGWRIRKDGERFFVNTVITALRNPDGSVRGFAKITRDLTARRKAEEQLRRSEEIFRLLVASVKDYAIFMLDPDGRVATWNAGARAIKGYEASEIIGKHFSVFYPEEDIASGKPERELELATRYGSLEDEGWRLRKDGTRFWASVVITAVFDEQRTLRGFAKVTRDVTDRRTAEEMQRLLAEQREARIRAESSVRVAQEANRAKDNFLMTLSHELRTPMTSVLGWSRLLPSLEPGTSTFRDGIEAIARSAQVQAQLIDDLLDVSRIVSGKLRLSLEEVEVGGVVAEAVETVRPAAEARGVTITTEVPPDLGSVWADRTRLHQIIWNLLTNAVKFTPAGGYVKTSAANVDGQILITVSDSGEGIDPDFLPHLFEPFRQSESPSTRVHGGLGLGLSIVRYLVEAHGGAITASSAGFGHGAVFTFSMPVKEKTARAAGDTPSVLPPSEHQKLSGMRIMVVDDDREGRQLVKAALQHAGGTVSVFESAPLALAEFSHRRPDVVITDIAMPAMDGYELAKKLRASAPTGSFKLVALTAFPANRDARAQSGFDAYLTKPIDPFSLVDEIVRVTK